jgi:hypothetical protein
MMVRDLLERVVLKNVYAAGKTPMVGRFVSYAGKMNQEGYSFASKRWVQGIVVSCISAKGKSYVPTMEDDMGSDKKVMCEVRECAMVDDMDQYRRVMCEVREFSVVLVLLCLKHAFWHRSST